MGSLSEEVRTEVLCGRICELEAENAKLRELAKNYEALTATLCKERNSCDGCPFDDPERIVCEHMRMQTCLSELGVEVKV